MKFHLPLALFLSAAAVAEAQFACTSSGTDEDTCLGTTDESGASCVWCSVFQLGFCVDEEQAEAVEENLPGVQCDRASNDDDDDDAVPPTTDDGVAPSDDALPPDYWTCLLHKTDQACAANGCTWCNTKGGFGVCMTGPSAESAEQSDWFDCDVVAPRMSINDPYDPTCTLSYLQNPTDDGCTSAVDSEGSTCELCDWQGNPLCLNPDQAAMAQQIGVSCDANVHNNIADPYDPTCAVSFLQNPTQDGCKSAVDADGNACLFCDLQGNPLCLNAEQAQFAEQLGVTCDSGATVALRGAL